MDPITYDADGTAAPTVEFKGFSTVLNMFAVSMDNRLVIGSETSSTSLLATSIIVYPNAEHPTVSALTDKDQIVISEAGSLLIHDNPSVDVIPLLETDASCFARSVDQALISLKISPTDAMYIHTVAAIAKRGSSEACIFTSSSIIDNTGVGISGNPKLITSIFEHLSEGSSRINIPTRELDPKDVYLSPRKANALAAGVLAMMPLTVLLVGLTIFRKRRTF